ncbi:MAG: isoprenylcysteine carboxylmethyltransferase family protein [Deltaproteobacteria bacterium]|nr:isoprenylcysteine carboxylmethyltransferase family protein [Deltaproteobacteria bacterium]
MVSFLKILLAFAIYAGIHSLLLTRSARLALEALFGQRLFRRWFRLCYSIQAAVLFLVFLVYAAVQPDIELLVFYGQLVWLLYGLRLLGLGILVWSLWAVGFTTFLGIDYWRAGKHHELPAGDGIDAPEFTIRGPYRWVRHPMYSGGFLLLWALPYWTLNILAFNLAATTYLWLAVRHEEARLVEAFGDKYRAYQATTPRFFPRFGTTGGTRRGRVRGA